MRSACLLLVAAIGCGPKIPSTEAAPPAAPAYPDTRRGETVDTYHGVEVADPYRWMEDMGSREVGAWVVAQNALTQAHLDQMPHREAVRSRLEALWNHARYGVPQAVKGTLFYSFNPGLADQPEWRVSDGPDGEARTLLDPMAFSADGTTSVASVSPSPDATLVAYGLSEGGSDWRTVRIRDVATGEDLDEALHWVKFSRPSWHPDGTGFWYSRYPEPTEDSAALAHQAVYFHRIGTAQSEDVRVVGSEEHPKWGFASWASDDDAWLITQVWEGTDDDNRVWLRPLDSEPDTPFTKLLDARDAEYSLVTATPEGLIFKTDLDAPRGRLIRIDPDKPDPSDWVALVDEAPSTLRGAQRVGDHLVLSRLSDAHSELHIHGLDGTLEHTVALPGLGTVGRVSGDRHSTEGWLSFSSFLRPGSVYRLDADTGSLTLWREPDLDFDAEAYVTEQVFTESTDGTTVPVFLTHRIGQQPDGTAPVLLYGYGGFDIPITPSFKVPVAVWLEMGGVYASANLRGGGEYGEEWHDAGTKTDKQNVFDDFIGAAEWLVDENWTNPQRLGIHGRSNGGLLVGATLIQRPNLFGAALPQVGVLDMMRYHRFTIGWAWAGDYGTVEDAEQFRALHAYSPVHAAPMAQYPPTLITTGDHDDRVVPVHSYKFAATLQHAQLGREPVLIRVDTRAGHGAGKSVGMSLDEWTDQLTFLSWALKLEPIW